MTRFAVVRDMDALADMIDGLDAWAAAHRALGAPQSPIEGVWVEQPAEAALVCRASGRALADGPARLRLQFGPGTWTICVTEQAVTPDALIGALKAAAGVGGDTRARFVPVFDAAVAPSTWAREWHDLAARWPGLVLPPLVSDAAGRLRVAAPLPGVLQPVSARGAAN